MIEPTSSAATATSVATTTTAVAPVAATREAALPTPCAAEVCFRPEREHALAVREVFARPVWSNEPEALRRVFRVVIDEEVLDTRLTRLLLVAGVSVFNESLEHHAFILVDILPRRLRVEELTEVRHGIV